MQADCILIASNFVIRPQILIFSVPKNVVSFPILIADKFFHVTSFGYTFAITSGHRKFVTADVTAVYVCQQSTWYSATRIRF